MQPNQSNQSNQQASSSSPVKLSEQSQTQITASSSTREKAASAKAYIENKYAKAKYEERERKEAWDQLQQQMEQMKLSDQEKELIKQEILHKESENFRLARTKMSVKDFIPRKIIGRGAFGEVRVCRHRKTNEVVAVKKMKKQEMLYKNQVAHVRAERDILSLANNPWIVELKYSFQDEKYLYLVMEYLQGGDLMTLLMDKEIFSEEMSRFYIAETIMAIESVHNLNYIHRDLKPDNLILGRDGHIKLSDFGLCKHVEIKSKSANINEVMRSDLSNISKDIASKNPSLSKTQANKRAEYIRNRQLAFSTVGTPDYIAPEVFGQQGYNETVDWWSAGAILFEMMVGYPPFFSDEPSITCQKILHWKKTLNIPEESNLSPEARDLLKRLLCDAENRLGANGVQEIKNHPFFKGLDWNKLRSMKSPFIPTIKDDEDCSRFDDFEEEDPFYPPEDRSGKESAEQSSKKAKKRKDINFPGYTYKKEVEEQKTKLVQALKGLLDNGENDEDGNQSPPEQEQRIPQQQLRPTANQVSRQQTIEQKNKQIAIKNTNVVQQPASAQPQYQGYNNQQMGQGASGSQTKTYVTQNSSASNIKPKVVVASQKREDIGVAQNQLLVKAAAGVTQLSQQQVKKAYSRNGPNNLAAATAGPLLQGAPKQQMNFTSYESGFGVNQANGPTAIQGTQSQLQSSTNSGQAISRNMGVQNLNSALLKSHQQMPGYQQSSSLSIKQTLQGAPASSTQQKFLSKSPNTSNKLMSNTNYGKFKAIPTNNAISANQPYTRGPGIQPQYLPKLGGTSSVPGQSQLSNYQAMIDRQTGSNTTSQNHLAGTSPVTHAASIPAQQPQANQQYYAQQVRSKQSPVMTAQQTIPGSQATSSQQIKIAPSQVSGGMQSVQALNFRQNLNMSLQQIQSQTKTGQIRLKK